MAIALSFFKVVAYARYDTSMGSAIAVLSLQLKTVTVVK